MNTEGYGIRREKHIPTLVWNVWIRMRLKPVIFLVKMSHYRGDNLLVCCSSLHCAECCDVIYFWNTGYLGEAWHASAKPIRPSLSPLSDHICHMDFSFSRFNNNRSIMSWFHSL
jgi:hypothetical protein